MTMHQRIEQTLESMSEELFLVLAHRLSLRNLARLIDRTLP